ncbi:MAG: hypothetical protein KDD22_06805 [Bdellovibrionales bacterium]|nr:hypothetical protein [Bdellovibrionales bacterium]
MEIWTLIHQSRASVKGALSNDLTSKGLYWETCLREICILPGSQGSLDLADSVEVFSGEAAYQFLLEILCGLHSPLVGETEVFGQFKEFFAKAPWKDQPQLGFFREVALKLLVDTKKVRTQFIEGLGSQSYGSLTRRWTQSFSEIHILGGGRLVQDLMPWLKKGSFSKTIYVRNPDRLKSAEWFQEYLSSVKVLSLLERPQRGGLIVAAPLKARDIEKWLASSEIKDVLDLRGESKSDGIQNLNVVALEEAFSQIQSNKEQQERVRACAVEEIQRLSQDLYHSQKVRPFGWDDLCA